MPKEPRFKFEEGAIRKIEKYVKLTLENGEKLIQSNDSIFITQLSEIENGRSSQNKGPNQLNDEPDTIIQIFTKRISNLKSIEQPVAV